MLRNLCNGIVQNKNWLMFLAVAVYILALFATLSNTYIIFSIILTFLFVIALIKEYLPIKYIFVLVFIFYLGFFNTNSRLKETDELLNIAPVNSTIWGQIVSIPQKTKTDKQKFFFKVNKIEYDGIIKEFDNEKVLLTSTTDKKLKIYEDYKFSGRLALPFKAGNPSQFDYSNYLQNYGTYAVFYNNDNNFEKLNSQKNIKEKCLQKINDYREHIINIHSNYLKSPNLEVLGGIVFGDDAIASPENIKKSFINSGLLHILAASGMNVAFIFSFFFFILSTLRVNYRVNLIICMFMIIIYALMTGLGASVLRATLMLLFILLGKLIDRDAHSIALLSFVAFLLLLYNPLFINDVGFQLSFIVTFGLLLTTQYLIKHQNKFLNWCIGAISVPIIAQLWVIPIQIFYFNNISIYSIFANIMSVPILSIISFGGFISSLLAIIAPISHFICKIFDFILNPLISILINISDFWGTLPNATYQTTHPNIIQILLYYSILTGFILLMNNDFRQKGVNKIVGLIVSFIAILLITNINIPNKNLEIITFDVGNADSFLIKTPKQEYIMIDTAKSGYDGGKSQAEIIILKYLKDNGIKKLKTIIVSHFDNDHCGGVVDILNNIKVEKIYVNNLQDKSNNAKLILETAKKQNVEIYEAKNKQIIYNNSDLKITNFIDNSSVKHSDNENSIINLLEYKNFKMLFMADADSKVFNNLKNNFPQNIDVLKVGHHGAKGVIDRNMINYLSPKYSIISVGENKFGHPNIITLKLLEKSKILRTDKVNSIKIIANKNDYKILKYDVKRKKYLD